MKIAGVIVAVAFAGMALFGVFGMHVGMVSHGGGCIAATAQATPCPTESNLADYVSFHYESFKKFGEATIVTQFLGLLAFVFLAFLSFGYLHTLFFGLRFPGATHHPRYSRASSDFLHWISLHENSPAHL